eukprot:CAMPEP_0167747672 /NCGR_PEP_ID=MMETSP0110_2-20121227/4412_1 /TAXON_ID=629695 /ORGANISM="Gymnochlora sp., Strain CCMP2014" /LENGTH=331 /DNA_ID=CAMNT_0007632601 /DNA_START=293 /DNA_END=1288 /DNA_ORIENTATION=+
MEIIEELPTGRSYLELDCAEEIINQPSKFVIYQAVRPPTFLIGEEATVIEAVVILNTLIRDAWQKQSEKDMIPKGEVYQFHAIVRKVNRKKKTQDRVLVVSSKFIYNLEEKGAMEFSEFKWSLPIESLLRVAAGKDDPKLGEYPATIHFDLKKFKEIRKKDENKKRNFGSKSNVNDKFQLLFVSKFARDQCLMALRALYISLTKQELVFDRDLKGAGLRRSQLGVVVKEGVLEKYTRSKIGRTSTHDRFVQIKSTGTISWGKSKKEMKQSETIVDVQASVALDKFKLKGQDMNRFFTVLTTGKSLYFLAKTVSERADWTNALESIIRKLKE